MPRLIIRDPFHHMPPDWRDSLEAFQGVSGQLRTPEYGLLFWDDRIQPWTLSPDEMNCEWVILFREHGTRFPSFLPRIIEVKLEPWTWGWVKTKINQRSVEKSTLHTPLNIHLVKEQEKLLHVLKGKLIEKTEKRRLELESSHAKVLETQQKLVRLNALISELSQAVSDEELMTIVSQEMPTLLSSPGEQTFEDEFIREQIRQVTSIISRHRKELHHTQELTGEWTQTFDSIDDPIALIDRESRVLRFNKSFEKRLLIQQSSEKLHTITQKAFSKGEKISGEIYFEKLSQWYFIKCLPVILRGQEPHVAVLYYRDITAARNIRKHILHAEKLTDLGVLAGSVAHEINNPLAGIIAFVQIIKSTLGPDHPCYQDCHEMEKAALQCRNIVQNLLGFSRKTNLEESGLMSIQQVFETIGPLILLQLKHENITSVFHLENDSDQYSIHGSFNHLLQIFLNLSTLCLEQIRNKSHLYSFHWSARLLNQDTLAVELIPRLSSEPNHCQKRETDQTLWNLCHYVTEALVQKNQGAMVPLEFEGVQGWRLEFPNANSVSAQKPRIAPSENLDLP